MRRLSIVPVLLAVLVVPAAAAVLYVPGTYPTIQQALNAAGSGDVILVAPGTYKENLTWPSTDGIRLVGACGWAQTTIDGNQNGRVISFGSGLTRATVLEGFTVTGGFMNTSRNYGCGIHLSSSSPTIRHNHITGNVGDGTSWNYGGGFYLTGSSRPLIERNLISKNILRNGSWNYGAGIYVDSGAAPDIIANQILENENQAGSRGYGGGIFVGSSTPSNVVSNVIAGNLCQAGTWNYGGGIRVYTNGAANIVNNTIVSNICNPGSYRYGGGIEYAGTAAGAIFNNIVVGNTGATGGGITVTGTAPPSDFNNVWNNTGGDYNGLTPGPNSIALDPLFGGTQDYHLTFRSPCIDAGSQAALGTLALQDYDGDSRRLDGNLDGLAGNGATLDIGADEFGVGQLAISGPPQLGTKVTFDVTGPAGAAWVLLYSPWTGSVFLDPYGYMLVGVPFGLLGSGAVPGKVPLALPSVAALIGVTVHVQGVVALVVGGQPVGNATNRLDLTFF
ncbi:MAG: right-handed parallel beta-helix repeat-containing protein [Planctomycetes bacterium]|nr:right-handed parallel beta-helix repeat-containing protein [Planctomycetota bacterium]